MYSAQLGKYDHAFQKNAAASSTLDVYAPSFVTSGNVHDPHNFFHTYPLDTKQWVEVDLEASYNLAEIQIHNRYNYAHARIIGFYVHLLNETKDVIYEYSYDEWNGVLGRYNKVLDSAVNVHVSVSTPLQIQEVVVYQGN
eukprot:Awhi_evm2s6718